MLTLQSFYKHFQANADDSVRPLWKYTQYETKFGDRREIQFIGASLILLETPPDSRMEFMAMQTQDSRVYRHGAYLISVLADYFLTEDKPVLSIRLAGQGYQAMLGIRNVKVEAVTADGTIEGVNRFGDPVDRSVTKINGVRLSRFPIKDQT